MARLYLKLGGAAPGITEGEHDANNEEDPWTIYRFIKGKFLVVILGSVLPVCSSHEGGGGGGVNGTQFGPTRVQ